MSRLPLLPALWSGAAGRSPVFREFCPAPVFDLYPVGSECRGTCRDCRSLLRGSSRERQVLSRLLLPLRAALHSGSVAGVAERFATASPRVQHLYVSSLRFSPELGKGAVAALSFPDLSGFDLSVLLSWLLAGKLEDPAPSRSKVHSMVLTYLRQCGDLSVRLPLLRALLEVYANPDAWWQYSLVVPLDYAGLDVEREDLGLAAMVAALTVAGYTGQDARPALAALGGMDPAGVELFVGLARDFTLTAFLKDGEGDLYQMLDLASLVGGEMSP